MLSRFVALALVPFLLAGPPRPLDRGPGTSKQVAFTVNVVWGTEHVLPIAEAFHSRGMGATFMLGGRWAKAHPDVASKLVAMGMEIGSHGESHAHVGNMGIEGNLREIDEAQASIEAATGKRPTLYAPAYGEVSPAVLEAAAQRKMKVVMWTIDTIDWRPSHTPDVIQGRVMSRLVPEAFILIHPTDRTVKAIGPTLDALAKRGYRAVSVSDILATAPVLRHLLASGEFR